MTLRLLAIAALHALLLAAPVGAKTLYVNSASGNDSTSYASNSSSAPWRSLSRAVMGTTGGSENAGEAARAGDTVLVTGGPFTATATNSRYLPAFNPANSGTAAAPITFRAQGRVDLRTTGGTGPVMGMYRRDYIRWEGQFFIDEANAPPTADTGPIVVWYTTGSVIDGCEVEGRGINYVDNHNGVRFTEAHNSVLRNCRINRIIGTTAANDTMHHNKAGVMLYYSDGITIENNEFTNSGVGIFPKGGDNYNITIRYNKVSGSSKGIRLTYSAPGQGTNRVYQNVVMNGVGADSMGIEIAEGANNWTIANNTVYNVDNGIYVNLSGVANNNRIASNVITDTSTAINAWTQNVAVPGPGRNVYYNPSQWAWAGRTYSALSGWLGAITSEANSVVVNPQFVSASGGDFHLASGSPARTAGLDLLDLNGNGSSSDAIPAGAYVRGNEVIGRGGSSTSEPQPAAPANLTVE